MTLERLKFWVINPTKTQDTNLCTNPSFESGTTGWTTGGTNTIATSATQQRRGVYSCKCTYHDTKTNLAAFSITLTATTHTGTIDIYIPSDYDGTSLSVGWSSFTSSTSVVGKPDMTITDKWQRVTTTITPDAGDLSGFIIIYENGDTPTAGQFIYIDGVQIEAGDKPTTYFDGDTDEYCYWSGQQNASTSIRRADSRNGGALVDLENYMHISSFIGFGMNPIAIAKTATAGGRSLYQRTNKLDREMIIIGEIIGNSYDDLQTNRKALLDLFKPDLVNGEQEVTIRYMATTSTGLQASEVVDIRCRMKSDGLIGHWSKPTQEPITLMFEAYDDLTRDGNDAVSLDYNDTVANVNYIVKRDRDGVWHSMDGLNATIYAIAQHPITKEIFIGGSFTNAGGDAAADYLAKWDVATGAWVAVVAGIDAPVRDLVFDANGNLYICGLFTNLGNPNGDYIAKIDTSGNISSLGTGMNGDAYKLLLDSSGNLYASGVFTLAGGTAASKIAKWDGAAWSALGSGLNGYVNSIVLLQNGDLIVGGQFTTAGGKSANKIAKWDGAAWSALGSGLNGNVIRIVVGYDNNLYIGGGFTSAGSVSLSDRVAIYLGNGIYKPLDINFPNNPDIFALFIDEQHNLYIGFTTSGSAETAGDDIVTNAGTTTRPKFTITGPGLLRQIVNTTNNKGVYFNNFTLQSGEIVTLDFEAQEFTSKFRGNILSYILEGISTLDFTLEPGSNRIATFIDGTTDSNTTALIEWKVRYWSLDEAKR